MMSSQASIARGSLSCSGAAATRVGDAGPKAEVRIDRDRMGGTLTPFVAGGNDLVAEFAQGGEQWRPAGIVRAFELDAVG
jgi:hypothetical protein